MEENTKDPYQSMVEGKDQEIINEVKKNGLGKASMARFQNETLDSDLHLGWVQLNLNELPSQGKFYPTDAVLKIRSAKVAEIRAFSIMDEGNLIDIESNLNAIVKGCTQFKSGTKMLSYKDILEED